METIENKKKEIMRLELVHIPKTAGRSLLETYPECQWNSKKTISKVRAKIPYYFEKKCPCNFWHNHELISALYGGDAKTFCVIRDPVDRLVSEYKHRKLPDDAGFFNHVVRIWRKEVEENPFMLDNHLRPQHLFAEQCDHVLLLDKDFEKNLHNLLKQYCIKPKPLHHIGSHPYQHVNRQCLSKKNLVWVHSYYKKDFEMCETYRQ